MLLVISVDAQHTEIYSSNDAAYSEGVSLYQQGQFSASYQQLSNYLKQTGDLKFQSDASFYLVANAFELRRADALQQLQHYAATQPYTTYASETYYMHGVLQVERRKYKQALKLFEQVDSRMLFRPHQMSFLFHKGYAHLQMNEYQKASVCFDKVRKEESVYTLPARYYYGFCQYTMQNYGRALPEFLAIEHTTQYRQIVPYYIIQIYYAQRQYDEVYERAKYLLESNPDNENNGEVYRILGEIYYQEGNYGEAITYLKKYEKLYSTQKKELLREDIYLLGMSNYQLGNWKAAAAYLQKVKKEKDELSENTCYHLGNAYVQLGQPENAKMAYSAVIHSALNDTLREESMYNYALISFRSSSALGESVTAFSTFLKEYPASKHKTRIYELMCDAFMASKNYKSALSVLDSIANPTPEMQETKQYLQYQIGTDLFVQGKVKEAKPYFESIIEESKDGSVYKTESFYWRGECYYQLKEYQKAIEDYQLFRKQPQAGKSKNMPLLDYETGYAYFAQNKYTEARKAFESYVGKADKGLVTYTDALNRLGDCSFIARDFVKAESYYAKVISLGGSGRDYAMFQRGYALGLLKRYTDKIHLLEQLVKQWPKSDYADDALYEIARSELQQENNEAALRNYDKLLASYPNSPLARKASIEKAMTYYNMGENNEAVAAYKQVIKNYPGSEEAYSALDGLQAIYIETNNVSEFLAYTKTLGKISMVTDSKEDSLMYVAAERQYILGNYQEAVGGLGKYISQYCSGGRYCIMAQHYLADSYYRSGNKEEAKNTYKELAEIQGNPYMEEACMRVAEIDYDQANYKEAQAYFKRLQDVASSIEKENIAQLGILRCSYNLQDNETTIAIATRILDDVSSSAELQREARYNRGKAYYSLQQYQYAIEDLTPIAAEVRTAQGAEAKYMLAEAAFMQDDLDKAEAEIMEFANMNTQHQYWLAKGFILLSDIYVKRGEDFQAKQYLLSLQSNYQVQDDIQDTIKQRLTQIEERENEKIEDNEEDL